MRTLWLAPLMFIGCDENPPTGDETDTDTDADADTDSDTDTDTDADSDADTDVGTSTSFDCVTEFAYWRVSAPAGTVTVSVDTVAADSAFDAAFVAYDVASIPATAAELDLSTFVYIALGDDEVECTFPPPTYDCPSLDLPTTGADILIEVFAGADADCVGTNAEYTLTVSGGTATFLGNVVQGTI